jgi:phosphatidylinositol phospholipase C, beta
LTTKHGVDLDTKSLTICTNENYIDIEYTHIVFPDAATAKIWQDGLRKITHNIKASNVSARMSLMKQ